MGRAARLSRPTDCWARLSTGLVSVELVRALFELNVFVNIAARLPQILQNYKARRACLPAWCRGWARGMC